MLSNRIHLSQINSKWLQVFILILVSSSNALAIEIYNSNNTRVELGFWGQGWYQTVSNYDTNGNGKYDRNLSDMMFRRAYFYVNGNASDRWSFFVHLAADRLGQDAMAYNTGNGLGDGLAFRDGWVSYSPWGNNIIFQIGRMYVPLTRNYGTTSTKSLLTLDLNWAQGGYRGAIFYPNNVGRDDAVVVWGNLFQEKLQYRLMAGDGINNASVNPNDNPRFAGRISYNFFDTEMSWFNSGTYLGKKHILALGGGIDTQNGLAMGNGEMDYLAWTLDLHYDQPLGGGNGLTVQSSFINIENSPNGIPMTWLSRSDDAWITSIETGYYFGSSAGLGYFQPFAHYSNIHLRNKSNRDTDIIGLGLNCYLEGTANKISLEAGIVNQEQEGALETAPRNQFIFTLQFAAGI